MTTSVIVAGARTPIGKFLGAFRAMTATDLGAIAVRAALERSGVDPGDLGAVFMGNVVQAGAGPNTARIAAVTGGVPMSVPATTINKLCLSGLPSLALADQAIRLGQYETVLAGGFESMSSAPHLLPGLRSGKKYGSTGMLDSLETDALICAFDRMVMGAATERHQQPLGITREQQDTFAAESHRRAATATAAGRFADEIVPVVTAGRAGTTISEDEGVRPNLTTDQLARLAPAFDAAGTITAGSSSPLSDGAAALVVMSKTRAESLGLPWLAEIGGYGTVAGPDASLLAQPADAVRQALRHDGTDLSTVDLLEINEAFASVAIHSAALLEFPTERLNVNGGAIALGHPVGMSGARLALSLAMELRRRGGGTGVVAICGGGGQGEALVLRVPATS